MKRAFEAVVATGLIYFAGVSAIAQKGPNPGRPGAGPGVAGRPISRPGGPMATLGGPATAPGHVRKASESGKPENPGRGIGRPDEPGKPTPDMLLERNPQLAERVAALLPSGVDPIEASVGFKNLGQFIAASHVSHNLKIPFEDLHASLLAGNKLGEAIRVLRPEADYKNETKLAERQAKQEVKAIEREFGKNQVR